jgi:hypothetical protein
MSEEKGNLRDAWPLYLKKLAITVLNYDNTLSTVLFHTIKLNILLIIIHKENPAHLRQKCSSATFLPVGEYFLKNCRPRRLKITVHYFEEALRNFLGCFSQHILKQNWCEGL